MLTFIVIKSVNYKQKFNYHLEELSKTSKAQYFTFFTTFFSFYDSSFKRFRFFEHIKVKRQVILSINKREYKNNFKGTYQVIYTFGFNHQLKLLNFKFSKFENDIINHIHT